MFIVAVHWVGSGNAPVTLMFNTREGADSCHRYIVTGVCEVCDDFGTVMTFEPKEVRAIVSQDLARVHAGNQEAQILAAQAQASLQMRAQSDPKLRVLTPATPVMGRPSGFRT